MSIIKQDYGELSGGGTPELSILQVYSSSSSGNTYNYTCTADGNFYTCVNLDYKNTGHIKITHNGTLVVNNVNGEEKKYCYVEPCKNGDTISINISTNSYSALLYGF